MKKFVVAFLSLILVILLLVVSVSFFFQPEIEDSLVEEPTQVEDIPPDWFGTFDFFIVPAGEHITREKEFLPCDITISFEVIEGGSINILVLNESDYWKWRAGQNVQCPFPTPGGAVSGKITFCIGDGRFFCLG